MQKIKVYMVFQIVLFTLSLLYFSIAILPILQSFEFTQEAALLIALAWIVVAFLTGYRPSKDMIWFLTIGALFIVLSGTMAVLTENLRFIKTHVYEHFKFLMYLLIFDFYKKKADSTSLRRLIIFLIPPITISIVITLAASISDPLIIRSIRTSGEQSISLLRFGVGGYGFIYFIASYALLLIGLLNIQSIKSGYFKAMLWALLLLSTLLVIRSGFLIAMLLLLSGMFIWAIRKQAMVKLTIFLVVILLAALTYDSWINPVYITLDRLTHGTSINAKIDDVYTLLTKKEERYGSINQRLLAYGLSWNAFREHPVEGVLPYVNERMDVYEIIGQHSTFLDYLGLFGIVVGLLGIASLIIPALIMVKHYGHRALFLSSLAVFFFYLTLNFADSNVGYTIFFALPALRCIEETRGGFI